MKLGDNNVIWLTAWSKDAAGNRTLVDLTPFDDVKVIGADPYGVTAYFDVLERDNLGGRVRIDPTPINETGQWSFVEEFWLAGKKVTAPTSGVVTLTVESSLTVGV
jgi:hypothetical protein